jgi:chemotaxis protein histidine kinase CheA
MRGMLHCLQVSTRHSRAGMSLMKLSQEEIEARLAEVRMSYLNSLSDKREAIETQWTTLSTQWQPDTYQSLYLIIHSLAGSAETFGLAEITRDARAVIDLFKHHVGQSSLEYQIPTTITASIKQLIASMAAASSKIK